MTIRSLNTKYAGCEFRSRLEARYAAFFNALGIAWEYEPQGYQVTFRLANSDDTFNYLPDFWLPEMAVWFEVKGELDDKALDRLLNAAASLSSNNGAGCHDDGGHDLAVGGPLTGSGAPGLPMRLHMHKGDLLASCLWCGHPAWPSYTTVANDAEGMILPAAHSLLRGYYCRVHSGDARILAALDVARTARFEFGRKPRVSP